MVAQWTWAQKTLNESSKTLIFRTLGWISTNEYFMQYQAIDFMTKFSTTTVNVNVQELISRHVILM